MKVRIGKLIMDELSRYGVEKVFGVPGDYNLPFLDDVIAHENMEWVGNANELNASYAADGYARIKGLGALVTTYGVGELSAINGIGGAFAERVPVVQIVGAPPTISARNGDYRHHTLGEGNYNDFTNMYGPVSAYQVEITPENAVTEIPYAIRMAYEHKRPVHIHLPIDVSTQEVEFSEYKINQILPSIDTQVMVEKIETALKQAKSPVVIVGREINAFRLESEFETFVAHTNLPVAQLNFGKGAIDEHSPNYIGIYSGKTSEDAVRKLVDESDLILNIGAKLTDAATAQFSQGFDMAHVVFINENDVKVSDTHYRQVRLKDVLEGLATIDYHYDQPIDSFESTRQKVEVEDVEAPITQEIYQQLMNEFVKPHDIVVAEQGTSFFIGADIPLGKDNAFVAQPLWGSIGYTLPALLGTQLADTERRNILMIGDGSLQLTVQAFSTILKWNLKPIVFVINNDGYTIERKIHGERAVYNDIPMWQNAELPKMMTTENKALATYQAKTVKALREVLQRVEQAPDKMHVIEVFMDKDDAPKTLLGLKE
ncbi:alpha-keto acid decarboxylase family protein [Staphylococcus lutrae]|uniref:Alpha-keto-acid decarboxylase n=1 Tax=Staphylococcus lutrae TaxID=155085 RepID=A0AAC9RR75_9STAP|nr:thiamine pyrophosphate-binding protein [Staphylococcus lutrae]ARJ50818.1 pyruvate decarboxylase [Staphylococcus lutrae]PNZ39778.1 pyruvate decarboxylase [Staphylococcus lutrae]